MSARTTILAKRIKENPQDSFSKFALALELLKINKTDNAKVLFESIIENDPNYVGVYYHLGKLHEQIGENNLARNAYKQGIEISDLLNDSHSKSELQSALMALELDID
ncbi:MAG: hypothetical protein MI700_04410 [Balneolales bacterium]|nr:hypothetical protein [Balneolales bacterium]